MAGTLIRGGQIQPGTIPLSALVSGYSIPTANLAQGALFVQSGGSVPFTANQSMGGNNLQNVATPLLATDAVNKSYADAIANGTRIHFARVMSTTSVTLSNTQTIDGVTVAVGDRVFLTGQSTASQNGIWVVASGAWTRPSDWSNGMVLPEGQYIILDPDGTTYKNTKWFMTNVANVTVDTTATTFSQDLSGTAYTFSNGLSLAGTSVSAVTGNGITVTSNAITAAADATRANIVVRAAGISAVDGTAGQVYLANASGYMTPTSVSGDVVITSTGATTVNNVAGTGFVKYTNFVANETPSGAVNNTNTTYTLASSPQWLSLYLNGVLQEPGAGNDFTISGTTITMLTAPLSTDKLRAFYTK